MGSGSGPIGFGGRVDDRFVHDAPTAARAEHGLRRLLPGLAAARVERAWGGPIDATRRVPALPPEPLKRLGGGLVRAAIIACEEAEEEGRRASTAARAAAMLPRLVGMQIGTR